MTRVATHKVDNPHRFKVLKKRCITCPFSKNQTTVGADRLVDIKKSLRRTNRPFVCHDAMEYDLVCRGYFDTESNLIVVLARMLGITEFMTLEEAEMEGRCHGHGRHWFTDRVGEYRPDCRRCHAPNPRCPMQEDDDWKPCGRTTDATGYCGDHRPTAGDYLCVSCDHKAKDHTAFIGPCAECWRKLVAPPCPRFRLRDEDREEVGALKL